MPLKSIFYKRSGKQIFLSFLPHFILFSIFLPIFVFVLVGIGIENIMFSNTHDFQDSVSEVMTDFLSSLNRINHWDKEIYEISQSSESLLFAAIYNWKSDSFIFYSDPFKDKEIWEQTGYKYDSLKSISEKDFLLLSWDKRAFLDQNSIFYWSLFGILSFIYALILYCFFAYIASYLKDDSALGIMVIEEVFADISKIEDRLDIYGMNDSNNRVYIDDL